jgi:hypothetical protein
MESSVMQHSAPRGGRRRVDSIFNTVNQGGCEVWKLQMLREEKGMVLGKIPFSSLHMMERNCWASM